MFIYEFISRDAVICISMFQRQTIPHNTSPGSTPIRRHILGYLLQNEQDPQLEHELKRKGNQINTINYLYNFSRNALYICFYYRIHKCMLIKQWDISHLIMHFSATSYCVYPILTCMLQMMSRRRYHMYSQDNHWKREDWILCMLQRH